MLQKGGERAPKKRIFKLRHKDRKMSKYSLKMKTYTLQMDTFIICQLKK